MTFEQIGKEGQRLAFGDFMKFCTDFGLITLVSKDTLNAIYRVKV